MVNKARNRKSALLVVLVVAAVSLTAGVAIAIDSSSEQNQNLTEAFAPKAAPDSSAPERSDFAIANGVVGAKAKISSDPMMRSHGVDAAAARAVETDLGDVIVAPGAASLCIFATDPRGGGNGGTCASYEEAKNGQLILTFTDERGKDVSVFAVIPDGIGSVKSVDRSGTARSVSVKNNVAAFKSADPAAVEIGEITSKL